MVMHRWVQQALSINIPTRASYKAACSLFLKQAIQSQRALLHVVKARRFFLCIWIIAAFSVHLRDRIACISRKSVAGKSDNVKSLL